MRYREIDDMYYVGDMVDVDGNGWVNEKTFDLLCKENKISISSNKIKLITKTFDDAKKLFKLFRN